MKIKMLMYLKKWTNISQPLFFTTAARWAGVVIESKSCLIACLIACLLDLPTFPYRSTRDIVGEGDELEEVKTVSKSILKPG